MFTIILYDFGMILLELTWIDVVFSKTTMVFFLCRNKILRMGWKSMENIFGKYKKYWSEELGQEVDEDATSLLGVTTP